MAAVELQENEFSESRRCLPYKFAFGSRSSPPMPEMGQTRRLSCLGRSSCLGISASPPTSDISLRGNEPTLRPKPEVVDLRCLKSLTWEQITERFHVHTPGELLLGDEF